MIDTRGTYSIYLLDHDTEDWSLDLSAEHLEGPSSGLSWRQIGAAIRELRQYWEPDLSIFVEREN